LNETILPLVRDSQKSNKQANNQRFAREMSQYLKLENIFVGLDQIVQRLFGLRLQQTSFGPHEQWHPDVLRFELLNGDKVEGVIYFDLFSRPDKLSLSATYSIRFCTDHYGNRVPYCSVVTQIPKSDQEIQLLSPQHANLMFHEFGHALNVVLSRTRYQLAAGVRSSIDYVEMPSQLMENFLDDYRVLETFATHYATGEVISKELLENYRKTKSSAIEWQQTILWSAFDMKLHSNQSPNSRDAENLLAEVKSEFKAENVSLHEDFYHLVGYGAGYYCYALCKTQSEVLWKMFCKGSI